MVHKTRDIDDVQLETREADEPVETDGTRLLTSGVPSTHPDPERERYLDALLERAWPRIKASMYYLRDR